MPVRRQQDATFRNQAAEVEPKVAPEVDPEVQTEVGLEKRKSSPKVVLEIITGSHNRKSKLEVKPELILKILPDFKTRSHTGSQTGSHIWRTAHLLHVCRPRSSEGNNY